MLKGIFSCVSIYQKIKRYSPNIPYKNWHAISSMAQVLPPRNETKKKNVQKGYVLPKNYKSGERGLYTLIGLLNHVIKIFETIVREKGKIFKTFFKGYTIINLNGKNIEMSRNKLDGQASFICTCMVLQ